MIRIANLAQGLFIALGLTTLLLCWGGCQRNDVYPYNCPGVGEQETEETGGFYDPPRFGEDYISGVRHAYIDVNPLDANQIVTTKHTWNESAQQATYKIVVIDLSTLTETQVLDLPGAAWDDITWGKTGWIMAENILDRQIYLDKPTGGNLQRLSDPSLGYYHDPCWMAEGQEVLSMGDGPQGRDRRWRLIALDGTVKQETLLAELPAGFVRYKAYADWRADSLLVSSKPERRRALTVFSYPDLLLVKQIEVIDSTSAAAIFHQEWWPGTERILWLSRGGLYATHWQTEETQAIWEDCELPIREFAVMPDGKRILCTIPGTVIREDLGGIPEINYHLYVLELESRVLTKVQ